MKYLRHKKEDGNTFQRNITALLLDGEIQQIEQNENQLFF